MYFIYSLLLTLGFILLLPRFAIDALRSGKYVRGLRERLGNLPRLNEAGQPLIWLHCVSVGETEAARPLVHALRQSFPIHRLVVSTTTITGQEIARRVFAEETEAIFYFPIDWAWAVRRALHAIQPSAVLIMETELWPNMLRECRRSAIPVVLVNGRISQRSLARYKLVPSFMRHMLRDLSLAIMQSQRDATRIRELGMPAERTLISGSLKFESTNFSRDDQELSTKLRSRFGLESNQYVIVAASTHEPEERIAVEAFKQLKTGISGRKFRLILAPRHPERFEEVARLLKTSGLSYARRSSAPSADDLESEIVLLDSMGDLRAVYALADISFVGGSIVAHGGHNVLEPAAQGVCIVTGPHTQNFSGIITALLAEDAIVQLPEVKNHDAASALAATLAELLADETWRGEIGRRARAVCERNGGATEKTLQGISGLLKAANRTAEPASYSDLRVAATK